jgi:hypothetical protein
MFISTVPLDCINDAAYEYHIPAKLIIAVLSVEQGKVGVANPNKNGTYDLGPMQINTSWKNILSQYGISLANIKNNGCLNVHVGAWILSKNIADEKDLLTGIGDYHSHTATLNKNYAHRIQLSYTRLVQWNQIS